MDTQPKEILWKFREIKEAGDKDARMRILEVRGADVLVQDVCFDHWAILPTAVYPKADLIMDSLCRGCAAELVTVTCDGVLYDVCTECGAEGEKHYSLPGNKEKTGVADVVDVPKVSEGLGALERCPFCSGTLIHRGFMAADPRKHYRECMDCLAHVGGYDTPEEADAAWNRRDSNGLPLMGQGYCITDSCENIVGKKGELCAYCATAKGRNDAVLKLMNAHAALQNKHLDLQAEHIALLDDAAILSFLESGVTSLALADGGTIYFEPATEECDNRWRIDGSTESFDSLSDVIRAHFLGGSN